MEDARHEITRRELARAAVLGAGALGTKSLFGTEKGEPQMKLGLYSITYLGVWYRGGALTLEQVIARAKKYGYDGVEIDGKRPHGNPLDMPKSRCRDLVRYARDRGIEIYAVAGNNDFSSPIPEHREAQLVYMRELIRMTAELDAKILRVFLAWPGVTLLPEGGGRYDIAQKIWAESHKDFPQERIWQWCREGLKEACRFAADHGVMLALQNHKPVVHGYKDVLRMIQEVDSPNLKACFDARLEHEMGPEELVRAAREFGALQVLSHYGNEYSEAGGKIVLKEDDENGPAQVQGLAEIGYIGYLGFELCHPLPTVNGQLVDVEYVDQNARLAQIYARGLINEAAKQKV